jgi:thiol:disulfide interchange protein
MKKLLLFLAIGVVLWAMLGPESASGAPKFESSHSVALSVAKKEGKPVVLVFSASWCPPCQMMKKTVYPSDIVKPYHDKFVWAYLDVDSAANQLTAQDYGVKGIPHIEFVNASGEPLVEEQVGGSLPQSFAMRLASALVKARAAD